MVRTLCTQGTAVSLTPHHSAEGPLPAAPCKRISAPGLPSKRACAVALSSRSSALEATTGIFQKCCRTILLGRHLANQPGILLRGLLIYAETQVAC